jgi:hypothetical protein
LLACKKNYTQEDFRAGTKASYDTFTKKLFVAGIKTYPFDRWRQSSVVVSKIGDNGKQQYFNQWIRFRSSDGNLYQTAIDFKGNKYNIDLYDSECHSWGCYNYYSFALPKNTVIPRDKNGDGWLKVYSNTGSWLLKFSNVYIATLFQETRRELRNRGMWPEGVGDKPQPESKGIDDKTTESQKVKEASLTSKAVHNPTSSTIAPVVPNAQPKVSKTEPVKRKCFKGYSDNNADNEAINKIEAINSAKCAVVKHFIEGYDCPNPVSVEYEFEKLVGNDWDVQITAKTKQKTAVQICTPKAVTTSP